MENKTVGEIVKDDYRKASIMQKFNIDFCCGGGKTLAKACADAGIDVEEVEMAMVEFDGIDRPKENEFNTMSLSELVDHIQEKHHRYVKSQIPVLKEYLDKVKTRHAWSKPYLGEIAQHFEELADELTSHMQKEEIVLFPFIKSMEMVENKDVTLKAPFGTIENPINAMMKDHDQAGLELKTLSNLTNAYNPPEDACNTHRVSYSLLKDFEEDLMKHIHLENNVLFPKSLALEKNLKAS